MVRIKINNEKFRYDIYHVVSLFFDYNEVEIVDEQDDFFIEVLDNSLKISSCDDLYQYEFEKDLKQSENIKKGIFTYFTKRTKIHIPWGTLVGIRPTKRVLSLMEKGYNEKRIIEYFKKHNCTSEEKVQLCLDVAKIEKNFVNREKKNISVYIGMPFCPTRCLYCSFTSNPISGCKKIVQPYLEALSKEIEFFSNYINEKNLIIECVYFGGGTPTSINDIQFEEIMGKLYNAFIKGKAVKEFTVECGRPDSITTHKLKTMKSYGVDRISINPQSMNNSTLRTIGRNHTVEDIIEKFNLARSLSFKNINMDLIIGLPNEGENEVVNTCNLLKKLSPESITVHGMSIKRSSRLHEDIVNKVNFTLPSVSELQNMYKEVSKCAEELNMVPYYMYRQKNMVNNMENVGYSLKAKECIYNIQMIEEKQSIIALGADAVSRAVFLDENRHERFPNLKDVREYIKRINEILEKKKNFFNTVFD